MRELAAIKTMILSVLAILLATFGAAGATVIDFETLADSTAITTQFAGLTFSHATVLTAGVSLNEFEFPPSSGSNVAVDDGGPITITFDVLQASVGGRFTYLSPLTLTAFDAALKPIATDVSAFSSNLALSGDPGSSPNELLQVASALGIARVTIAGDPLGDSFALDDLTFIARPASQAPAPATGVLLGVGLIACGALRAARGIRRLRGPARIDPGRGSPRPANIPLTWSTNAARADASGELRAHRPGRRCSLLAAQSRAMLPSARWPMTNILNDRRSAESGEDSVLTAQVQ